MGTAIKHPVPNQVKPSLVIFDIRALLYPYGNSGRQRVDWQWLFQPIKFTHTLIPSQHGTRLGPDFLITGF